jgi:hypothetical protein
MTASGYLRLPKTAGLSMIIRWCMGVMQLRSMHQW